MRCLALLIALVSIRAYPASVSLAWNASPDEGIAEYIIRYGTSSNSYPNAVSAGTNLTKTIGGLAFGVRYYFVATAKNTNGLESNYSNEIFGSITDSNNVPPVIGPITDVTNSLSTSIAFTVDDVDTPVSSLVIGTESSNQGLVPNENIVVVGIGTNRTLVVVPASRQIGSTIITVSINDGNATVRRSFSLTIRNPLEPGHLQLISSSGTNVPMRFDGVESTMDFGDVDPLGGVTNGFVVFWMMMDHRSDDFGGIIVDLDDGAVFGWGITRGRSNNLHIVSRIGDMGVAADTGDIPTNTWLHIAVNISRNPKLWINGVEVALIITGSFPTAPALNTAPLRLGSFRGQYFFRGQLANIAIYQQAVSVADIQMAARDLTHRTVPPGYYVLYQ